MTKFAAIIPARYASTRFPGKPLALLGGKPIIKWVYDAVASVIADTFVATDDRRIYDAITSQGGKVVMTPKCCSGTDRVAVATEILNGEWDVIVNIQGDEPFIHPSHINSLCSCFADADTQIATLCHRFTNMDEVRDANTPKVVTDNNGYALYFSRSIIPFVRDAEGEEWIKQFPYMKHMGVYAYRKKVLREITSLRQSSLEKAESLEQLRWLQNGYKIKVAEVEVDTVGIDTPSDLLRAEKVLCRLLHKNNKG